MSAEKNKAWDVFMATLSPEARAALGAPPAGPLTPPAGPPDADDDEEEAFSAFLNLLSPAAREALSAPPRPAAPAAKAEQEAKWGLVEAPDGEWAKLRLYKTPEALARRVQQLEGTDTVVWCFYGVPLPLTKGPQRFIGLPGGGKYLKVPLYDGGPGGVVDDPGDLKVETNGFVGPPELAETHSPAAVSTGGPDDDEEDDD